MTLTPISSLTPICEMTLTPICSLESARKKFLMNSTYIMSRKWESNIFGLNRPK